MGYRLKKRGYIMYKIFIGAYDFNGNCKTYKKELCLFYSNENTAEKAFDRIRKYMYALKIKHNKRKYYIAIYRFTIQVENAFIK